MSESLTDFLLARIAEDEAVAQGQDTILRGYDVDRSDLYPSEGRMVLAYPARVLAECEAKRRIVEALSAPPPKLNGWLRSKLEADGVGWTWQIAREGTLAYLALPYADHDDYREEWRP